MHDCYRIGFILGSVIGYFAGNMFFLLVWSFCVSKSGSISYMNSYLLKHGNGWGKAAVAVSWMQSVWMALFPIISVVKYILICKGELN